MIIIFIEGMAVDSLQKGPVVASVALYTVLANLANKAQPPTQYRNASAALVRTRISAIGDCKLNKHIKWRDDTAADRADLDLCRAEAGEEECKHLISQTY